MYRWLGLSPPPVKKAKTSEERRLTQQKYEKEKRERKFQNQWRSDFKWLHYEETENRMYCCLCKKFSENTGETAAGSFITGTSAFKIDIIKKHETSKSHINCVEKENASVQKPGASDADRAVLLMDKAVVNKLCFLFRNAHFIAKLGKPYTEYVSLCQLDRSKELNIGNTYLTDKYCQKFIASIAETKRSEQKSMIENVSFLSVISDGATDCSSKETEIVYVRTADGCKIKTLFAGIKHVAKADADNISRAIMTILDKRFPNLWRNKLVALGTDGASVMVGRKGGVVKRIAEATDTPFLRGIHCSAHRYSPLNRANLKSAFESLGKSPRIPTRMGGTRWLPHTKRALRKVMEGKDGIHLHLEQQNPSKESSCKAKNFLKLLDDKSVQYWLHLMSDVISCLSKVSEVIQEKTSSVAEIFSELEVAKSVLNKYKTSDGPSLRSVMDANIVIDESLTTRKVKLLDSLISSITDRFAGDGDLFVDACIILTIKAWPDFSEELEFGDDQVAKLIDLTKTALTSCCSQVDINSVELEWTRLKAALSTRKQTVQELTWCYLYSTFGKICPNFFILVTYLLTLPGSSVDAERGFSCLKMVKSDWRSRLGEENLADQMMINIESDPIGTFDPMPAITQWYAEGKRAKRPYYMDEIRRCSLPRERVVISNTGEVKEAVETGEPDEGVQQMGVLEEEMFMQEHIGTDTGDDRSDSDEEETDKMAKQDLIELQRKSFRLLMELTKCCD